jgi:chromosome segregation ATPase
MSTSYLGQDDRIEELRDTHRLESASQSDQLEKLRRQLEGAEASIKVSQSLSSHTEEVADRNVEIDKLHAEVRRANGIAKEEEEKRVKAISLLKTVRQKLVKAEKDKEDALKELNSSKDKEKAEREKESVERLKLQQEIDAVNDERGKAMVGLKAQFDKEVANLKERYEKEASGLRAQFELESTTTKVRAQCILLCLFHL